MQANQTRSHVDRHFFGGVNRTILRTPAFRCQLPGPPAGEARGVSHRARDCVAMAARGPPAVRYAGRARERRARQQGARLQRFGRDVNLRCRLSDGGYDPAPRPRVLPPRVACRDSMQAPRLCWP